MLLFTFSLYSSFEMEQFKMEGSLSRGMVITLATVRLLGDAAGLIFCFKIDVVQNLHTGQRIFS